MTQRHALVVDDSKSARFALRKQLETLGYRVDAAESLQQALASLRGARPDIVFLDYVMPDVSGFEALEAIRRESGAQPCPVIMCTSSEGEEFSRQARARGAADTLPKPPSPQRLAAILTGLDLLPAAAAPMADPARAPATVPMAAPAPAHSNEAPRGQLSRLDVVERHLRLLSGRVTQELATLRATIGERDSGAEGAIAALRTRVDALGEAMVAAPAPSEPPASPAIDALLARVDALERQHQQSRTLLAERDQQLAAVAARCSALHARLEEADGRLATQARQQSALDQRMGVLERLAPALAAIDAIGERLAELEQSATRLAGRLEQRLTALEQPRAPLDVDTTPATQTPAPLTERPGTRLGGSPAAFRDAERDAAPATVATGFSGWLAHALRRKPHR